MGEKGGNWVKLHREITDSFVFDDAEMLKLWIYLLCNAAYLERDVLCKGALVHLLPGELIIGRNHLAHVLNISPSKIYRSLKRLQKAEKVRQISTNKFTKIILLGWDKLQSEPNSKRTSGGQAANSGRTADEHIIRNKEKKKGEEFDLLKNNFPSDELERLSWQATERCRETL